MNRSSSFPDSFIRPILQGITIYRWAAWRTLVKVESDYLPKQMVVSNKGWYSLNKSVSKRLKYVTLNFEELILLCNFVKLFVVLKVI